ncbi:MAG: hypothetical protein E6K38_04700 [Gammaproteobacteria bacterium]|nr:MAG: hypothetical protein E6K38_04700 [Gammaproteobacteria bacterium]
MFDTRNDLPANVRTQVIELLNARRTARGTLAAVARSTSLRPYPEDISEGLAHVDALSAALAAFGAKVRAGIDEAARLADADSADLFTGISRETDKDLWFLEAHLHAKR